MRTLIFLASLTFGSWSIATAQTREPIENSVGMKLVLIPDGQLTMGSPPSEPQADDDERQYLAILSKPFYMGVTEVTQGQYQKVMGTNPSSLKDAQDPERSANMPVEQVSWEDAFEFCRRLSAMPEEKQRNRIYRLPTELFEVEDSTSNPRIAGQPKDWEVFRPIG